MMSFSLGNMDLVLITKSLIIILFYFPEYTESFDDYRNHPCVRPCNGTVMTCTYHFTLESYYVLSKACYNCPYNTTDCWRPHCVTADGVRRGIMVANRIMPGPAMHVCHGDSIVLNVHNSFVNDEGATIHFHGIHQRGTPHMDGATMITQCPIASGTRFQYKFEASPAGTHWWHGHSGVQRAEGLYGALIIRPPRNDEGNMSTAENKMAADNKTVVDFQYDRDVPEHVILLGDWLHVQTTDTLSNYFHNGGPNSPPYLLINGKGPGMTVRPPPDNEVTTNETFEFPRAEFRVSPGLRYRFRLINVGMTCAVTFFIDNHNLTVIATEAGSITPHTIDYLVIVPGESFDVVVHADQAVDAYWMRTKGIGGCVKSKTGISSAVLRYEGSVGLPPAVQNYLSNIANDSWKTVNMVNVAGSPTQLPVANLSTLEPDDHVIQQVTADVTHYIGMDFYKMENPHYHHKDFYSINGPKPRFSQQMNHITNRLPASPLLTQFSDIPKAQMCNAATVTKNCSKDFCECTHVVKVELGKIVELVVIDEGQPYTANHPVHLHGHSFRVIGMGKIGDSTTIKDIKKLDKEGRLMRRTSGAPIKDTVTVPDGGYTILRFKADNPGMWLFHCHMSFHVEIGMALTIQVGEPHQFPPIPWNFPRCGDWSPSDPPPTSTRGSTTPVVCDPVAGSVNVTPTVWLVIVTVVCGVTPLTTI